MSMPYLEPQDSEPPPVPSASLEPQPEPALPEQPQAASEPEVLPLRSGWKLVALIPYDAKEPPANLDDKLAQASWCAASALWHPSLLARAAELPILEPIETPSAPAPKEVRVVAAGALDRLPSGYRTQVEDAGAILLESGTDRAALIAQIQEHLGAVGTPETSDDSGMIDLAHDFLALGAARWLLRDLASAMGHEGAINLQALTREILAGADAWQACDRTTAVNRLRAGFEVLTQARERFYPVDAYLIDLCLLDPRCLAVCSPVHSVPTSPSRSSLRGWRSRTKAAAIPRRWSGFDRRSRMAGWTSRAVPTARPRTSSCRWSRTSGSSAAAASLPGPPR